LVAATINLPSQPSTTNECGNLKIWLQISFGCWCKFVEHPSHVHGTKLVIKGKNIKEGGLAPFGVLVMAQVVNPLMMLIRP